MAKSDGIVPGPYVETGGVMSFGGEAPPSTCVFRLTGPSRRRNPSPPQRSGVRVGGAFRAAKWVRELTKERPRKAGDRSVFLGPMTLRHVKRAEHQVE